MGNSDFNRRLAFRRTEGLQRSTRSPELYKMKGEPEHGANGGSRFCRTLLSISEHNMAHSVDAGFRLSSIRPPLPRASDAHRALE